MKVVIEYCVKVQGMISGEEGWISLGPWGGKCGVYSTYKVEGPIIQMTIRYGDVIDSILFESKSYNDAVIGSSVKIGGTGGGALAKFCIDIAVEQLSSISLTYKDYYGRVVIKSLCFETNIGNKYGPFGSESGASYVSIPIEGRLIAGFHGRGGSFLDAFGIFVAPKSLSDPDLEACEHAPARPEGFPRLWRRAVLQEPGRTRKLNPYQFLPSLDDSTEMSRGDEDSENALKSHASGIHNTITLGAQKTISLFSSACMRRVPENLRNQNSSAYTPHLISIGPYHQHIETPMQHIKLYYANNLFLRLTQGTLLLDRKESEKKEFEVLKECVKETKRLVDDAVKSYPDDVTLNEEMMVVDGCFILELLYKYYGLMKADGKKTIDGGDGGNSKASSSIQQPDEGEHTSKSSEQEMADPIFDSILTENIIKHDFLLLENQIPFFVLEKLFKLTVEKIPNCPHKCSLTDYVLFYFRDVMSREGNSTNSAGATTTSSSPNDCVLHVSGEGEQPAGKAKHYYHILHLLHENYLPLATSTAQKTKQKTKFSEFTLSASNLEYAGVQFKPLSGNNQFDVKFDEDEGLSWWCRRASFVIPALRIHDTTEPFLRNLIAFEQCVPGVSHHFTSYAFLMDMLINSEKDVQVLKDAKVMYCYLGADEDISNLFNKLCKDVVVEDFYFADTCSRAFKYSEYGWPKILAYLKRTYFASPWAFIGFCLAFIVFGMSVTQFVFSFFQ
ncbi:UPF0481 protein At3g47200-like isoform X3 [Rhododendron vialii]|uniref:UPF0481 protein At3g47200-like isoform X3 n=1 Tax=Rhododendron vialii TaxID=182163 RepID=UPI00265E4024|nr:UPF0481 protein At3g47200-like isoform X3 [Rhododendron vialii]